MPSWFSQKNLNHEIRRSKKEISFLGVLHLDLRPDNILWNAELRRAIIIDFHCAKFNPGLKRKQRRLLKRHSCGAKMQQPKDSVLFLMYEHWIFAGIHRNYTSDTRFRGSSSACTALIKIYCPGGHLGFRIDWMAAWLSVNMAHLPGVMSVVCMSSTICSARTSPLRSAAYPVNVADVPMY